MNIKAVREQIQKLKAAIAGYQDWELESEYRDDVEWRRQQLEEMIPAKFSVVDGKLQLFGECELELKGERSFEAYRRLLPISQQTGFLITRVGDWTMEITNVTDHFIVEYMEESDGAAVMSVRKTVLLWSWEER